MEDYNVKLFFVIMLFMLGLVVSFLIGYVVSGVSGSSSYHGSVVGSNYRTVVEQKIFRDSWFANAGVFDKVLPDLVNDSSIILKPKSIVIEGDYNTHNVVGKSMLPTMGNGYRVITKRYRGGPIRLGSIILFNSSQFHDELNVTNTAHRLVAEGIDDQGRYFITRGDNNEVRDKPVREKDVYEIVVGVIYG